MRTKTRLAALAISMFFATCSAFAAPPTIGGVTISGAPESELRILSEDRVAMMGAYAIHGADAFTWLEYDFWRQRISGGDSPQQVLQSIYDRPTSRTNFPSFLLNEEIVRGLIQNISDATPDENAVLFWTSRLNSFSLPSSPQRTVAKGAVMYEIINAALSGTDSVSTQFRNRYFAALVIKKETDTAIEQNNAVSSANVFAASRARLQTITSDVATYNAALTPLARLNWVIDQSAIAPAVSYNGDTGVLTISGTELVSLAGPNNDVNVSKLTIYGDGAPYALTTSAVEITNATTIQISLNAADRIALRSRLNRDGALSQANAKYTIAAAPGWSAALPTAQPQPALTGARMTALNTSPAILNIDNSDAATKYDAATDGVLLMRYLLGFRGLALVDNARGNGGNIRDSLAIESHLLASLALLDVDGDGQILASTDGVMILRRLLNPNAAISNAAAMSAITANAKRGTRTDAEIVSAIDALKP